MPVKNKTIEPVVVTCSYDIKKQHLWVERTHNHLTHEWSLGGDSGIGLEMCLGAPSDAHSMGVFKNWDESIQAEYYWGKDNMMFIAFSYIVSGGPVAPLIAKARDSEEEQSAIITSLKDSGIVDAVIFFADKNALKIETTPFYAKLIPEVRALKDCKRESEETEPKRNIYGEAREARRQCSRGFPNPA
ncbi:MAG: hypothetical protein ABSD68_02880 [Candidatus Micrarchaeales archaeon]|jgi:hypothetical protein